MPLYHFHVSDGDRPEFDTRDMEFPSPAAACADALRFAGNVLRDRAGRSGPEGAWRVELVDEAGAMLFWVNVTVGGQRSPEAAA